MASLPQRVDVAFTIPIEQTITPTMPKPDGSGGQVRLTMRSDITKTKRFFRRLQKLCKKYGYTIGEIQPAKESRNEKPV